MQILSQNINIISMYVNVASNVMGQILKVLPTEGRFFSLSDVQSELWQTQSFTETLYETFKFTFVFWEL